jgi:hypothetical protein
MFIYYNYYILLNFICAWARLTYNFQHGVKLNNLVQWLIHYGKAPNSNPWLSTVALDAKRVTVVNCYFFKIRRDKIETYINQYYTPDFIIIL